jgi:two-component system CheB/CheR fusion protein
LRRHSDEFGSYRDHVDAMMRALDAGVMVVDNDLKVVSWNRWSENAWGLREEEAFEQTFTSLDIGLPVQQLEQALRGAVMDAASSELMLDALDRRGRRMRCRVRVSPLVYPDRNTQGAMIVVEDQVPARTG